MHIQQEFHLNYPSNCIDKTQIKENSIGNYVSKLQSDEISNIYPQSSELPEKLELKDTIIKSTEDKPETPKWVHVFKKFRFLTKQLDRFFLIMARAQ